MRTPQLIRAALVLGLSLGLAACAAPTPMSAPQPTTPPEAAAATPMPAQPTAPPAAAAMGAAPAVQVVPLQEPDQYFVGWTAGAAVLAADSDGVGAVELLVDEQLKDSVPLASPGTLYQGTLTWTPDHAGPHNVVVQVRDAIGLVTQARWVVVQVLDPPAGATAPPAPATPIPGATPSGDTVPPSVSIAPADNEINQGEDVDVAVNAVDQGGVVKMELYADDQLVETWTYDPSQGAPLPSVFHTFTYRDVPEGQYDVYVRAYDSAGNMGQSNTERIDVNP
jgi:hypothetical protein